MQVASSIRDLASTRVIVVPLGNISQELVERCIELVQTYATVRLSSPGRWRSRSEASSQTKSPKERVNNHLDGESLLFRLHFEVHSVDLENLVGIAQVNDSNQTNKIQQEFIELCKQWKQAVASHCLLVRGNTHEESNLVSESVSDKLWPAMEDIASLDIASVEAENFKDELDNTNVQQKEISKTDTSFYASASTTGGDSSSDEDSLKNTPSHHRNVSYSTTEDAATCTAMGNVSTGSSFSNSGDTAVQLKWITIDDLAESSSKDWLTTWLASLVTEIHHGMNLWLHHLSSTADLIVSPMDADKKAEKFSKLVRRRASRFDKYTADCFLQSGNYQKAFMKYSACAAAARANGDWLWLAGAIEGTCACAILLGRDFTTLSGIANVVEVQPENRDLISQVIQRYDEICKLHRKKRAFVMEMFASLRLANFLVETNRRSEVLTWLQYASQVLEKMPNHLPSGIEDENRPKLLGMIGFTYLKAGCWRKASFYLWREAVGLRRQGDSFSAMTIIQQVISLVGSGAFSLNDSDDEKHPLISFLVKVSKHVNNECKQEIAVENNDNLSPQEAIIWPCLLRLLLLETASSARASGQSQLCLWSCLTALEISPLASPWDDLSRITNEDTKIIAWMLRYPVPIRIPAGGGKFIRFLGIEKITLTEDDDRKTVVLERSSKKQCSPCLKGSPPASPTRRKGPFIYSPFMNRLEQDSTCRSVEIISSTINLVQGEQAKFTISLENDLRTSIPLEILEILVRPVEEESNASMTERKRGDILLIHSIAYLLSEGQQSIDIVLTPQKTGKYEMIGWKSRLWNRMIIDQFFPNDLFVEIDIFTAFPTFEMHLSMVSRSFSLQNGTLLPKDYSENYIFFDGELIVLHFWLRKNIVNANNVTLSFSQQDELLELNMEQWKDALDKISLEMSGPQGNKTQWIKQEGRCLLKENATIGYPFPQQIASQLKIICVSDMKHEDDCMKTETLEFCFWIQPSIMIAFIGLRRDGDNYELCLDVRNVSHTPFNLQMVEKPSDRELLDLHLEQEEGEWITFPLSTFLVDILRNSAKDCNLQHSFSHQVVTVLYKHLECHWQCPLLDRDGILPLRMSSDLRVSMEMDSLFPRLEIVFHCQPLKKKVANVFHVASQLPCQIDIVVTNQWHDEFPDDLRLFIQVEQENSKQDRLWSNYVLVAGQWENIYCGRIASEKTFQHSVGIEFISTGKFYLMCIFKSEKWKTIIIQSEFLVSE
eukprot:jgi/Galph1/5296/GphlegSOOS_G3912.1